MVYTGKWHSVLVVIVLFFALSGIVSASIPDKVTFSPSSPSKNWVVANGSDSDTLILSLYNNTMPMNGIPVVFTINNSIYGTIQPAIWNTSSSGTIATTFYTTTKAGTANITATFSYRVNDSDLNEPPTTYQISYNQKIDHDTQVICSYSFNSQATVGTIVPINFSFVDQHGNPIDNRRNFDESLPIDQMNLNVISYPNMSHTDRAGFNDGNGSFSSLSTKNLDLNGTASYLLYLDTEKGNHELYATTNNMIVTEWLPDFSTYSDHYFFVMGIANGQPSFMQESIAPPVLWQYADGHSTFTINYLLQDQYRNGLQNSPIEIETLEETSGTQLSTNYTIYTNSDGVATLAYGPRTALTSWITSTSSGNASIRDVERVEFVNSTPVNMELYADPQTMPSLDAKSGTFSNITAKVVDTEGNPTPNEPVIFSINSPVYDSTNSSLANISSPFLSSNTAITDANGNAIVQFVPGSFTSNVNDPNYTASATGKCDVTATWKNQSHSVSLNWKNYPYLRVETMVSPKTVNVTGTVDVTLFIEGDGWALQPAPVDVVIVTDLAGGIGGPGRMVDTKNAELAFVANANQNTRIALVSFGASPNPPNYPYASQDTINLWNEQTNYNTAPFENWTRPFQSWSGASPDYCLVNPSLWNTNQYPDTILFYGTPHWTGNWNPTTGYLYFNPWADAKVDMGFSNKDDLDNTINGYNAWGGTDYAAGINEAMDVLNKSSIPGHKKAIIIMGDGINMMAPIAPGSAESYWPSDWYPHSSVRYFDESDVGKEAAIDAKNNAEKAGYTIYGAGFPSFDNGGNPCIDTDQLIAMCSDGDYYPGTGTSDLEARLQEIEKRIDTEAGVQTTANLPFNDVLVNSISLPAQSEFKYVPDPARSTKITQFHAKNQTTVNGVIDQTAGWDAGNLNFAIGTLFLDDTWQATFRLQLINQSGGNIKIFSPEYLNSYIDFFNNTGGENQLPIPDTSITSEPNLISTGHTQGTLSYSDPTSDSASSISNDVLTWSWIRNYTGNSDLHEIYEISIDNKMTWITVGNTTLSADIARNETNGKYILDLTKLPSNIGSLARTHLIDFQVIGRAEDVGSPATWFSRFVFLQANGKIVLV